MDTWEIRATELAIAYSKTGNETLFLELLDTIHEQLTGVARLYASTTNTTAEEYEIMLTEVLWKCIRDGRVAQHDQTKSSIMQRVRTYWTFAFRNHIRDERRITRSLNSTALRLDRTVTAEASTTLGEVIRDPKTRDIGESIAMADALRQYAADYPEDFRVVMALGRGDSGSTVAGIMGLDSYDARARKRVQRIRQTLRLYIGA